MPNDGLSMGYGEADQGILDSIHKKLNRNEVVETPVAAKPLPTPPAPKNVPMDVDLNPQPVEPAASDQPVEGQPAEGQPTEGEPLPEGEALALPPTIKMTLKGEDGKDVEQELPIDEVKSGYMRHADYTRKTQALAKERAVIPQRIAESERVVSQKTAEYSQALQQFEAFVLHAAAPELQNVNWNQLAVENPGEHVRLTQRANQVNATLQQIRNHQGQIAKEAEASRQRSLQESALQAKETLNREIPGGWNDDLYTKITKGAATHYGYLPEEFGTVVDARHIMMAHDALRYRELVSGKPIAQQKVASAPQLAVRPGATSTKTDARQTAVDKARAQATKSGSVDDALAVLQAKRARQAR